MDTVTEYQYVPQIYDVAIDAYRDVSQAELDELVKIKNEHSQLKVGVFKLINELKDVLGKLKNVPS
jgi:hypothetical protein